jgi:phenylpropionate dioxygenase-like ring-hydroxylating dioxygenase large terminal subunit
MQRDRRFVNAQIAGLHWRIEALCEGAFMSDQGGALPAVGPDVRTSATLPGWAYTDPGLFERERNAIHYRSWHYAGAVEELTQPGDYITAQILDEGVIIVRDQSGALKGFYNVCRHRAHELLRGRGRVRVITCPYHAWTYGTDGQFRAARGAKTMEGFDPAQFALRPIRVEVFARRFVFFNLDLDATPLSEQAGDLAQELETEIVGFEELKLEPEIALAELAANWKVVVDNYLECNHCAVAHPALSDLMEMSTFRVKTGSIWMSHKADLRAEKNKAYPVAPNARSRRAMFWWLWPTTTFNVLPGPEEMSVFSFLPSGRESTLQWGQSFSMPGAHRDEARHAYRTGLLTEEDTRLCESVQRGLRSKGYDSGRFVYDQDGREISEVAVHHFQRLVVAALERQRLS